MNARTRTHFTPSYQIMQFEFVLTIPDNIPLPVIPPNTIIVCFNNGNNNDLVWVHWMYKSKKYSAVAFKNECKEIMSVLGLEEE